MVQGQKIVRNSVKYSQNFLRDTRLVQRLVEKSSITTNDLVIDIGSGKGIITEILSTRCKKVIAVEADQVLAVRLKQKFKDISNIQIQTGDFLGLNLPSEPYKVFSNIPFNRTADIIRKLVNATQSPGDTYLIVQKESALKYIGSPLSKETLFSVMIKPWFELSVEYNFQRSDFEPRPNIDIVLLRIRKRETPVIQENQTTQYKDFVSYAFNRSNPNLKKGMKDVFTSSQFSRIIQSLHVSDSVTPTQLSFDLWIELFQSFQTLVDNQKKQVIVGSALKLAKEQSMLDKVHRTRVSKNWMKEAIS
jgi:23S rRNA (adenine-N6)-dimethyltransferase